MPEILIQLVPAAVILGLLIFIHELGHFLACRFTGVGVQKFSIGFGPEIITWQGRETRYAISLIPFGGFVKPKGETSEDVERIRDKEAYQKYIAGAGKEEGGGRQGEPLDFLLASKWSRFLILFGGVAMNYALAYLLFAVVLMVGRPVLAPAIGGFVDDYPAQRSGLRKGDLVTAVNGTHVSSWQELTMRILESTSPVLRFSVMRDGKAQSVQVKPVFEEGHDIFGQKTRVPRVGIKPAEHYVTERYGVFQSLVHAAELEWQLTALTYRALWRLLTGRLSPRAITGPIGIIAITGDAAKVGLVALLQLTAILSVSLAVINALPVPALDGGHLLFLALEVLFRKPVSRKFQEGVTAAGFYGLIALMILIVYNDLVNLGLIEKIKTFFSPS